MPAAMKVLLRGISGPVPPRHHRWPDNSLQVFGHILAILPAAEVQRVGGDRGPGGVSKAPTTHQMQDAGLDCGLREDCVDGVRKALVAVHCQAVACLQTMRGNNGDQDVFDNEPCCADCSLPRGRTWPPHYWQSTGPEPHVRPRVGATRVT
jgi:hypothetical protein